MISSHVNNYDKIQLSMISKMTDKLKYEFVYDTYDKNNIHRMLHISYCAKVTDEIYNVMKIEGLPTTMKYTKYDFKDIFSHTESLHNTTIYCDPCDMLTLSTNSISVEEFNKMKMCSPKSISSGRWHIRDDQKMTDFIGTNITRIYFGGLFDQQIPKLSESITHLAFGDYFNQSINGCISKSITHLTFGYKFNQPIKGCIPKSVTHLTFGYNFNQSIKGCIPKSVTHLTFDYKFNQLIKGCIPNSVTHLTFGASFNQIIKDCIPDSVTCLTISIK